MKKYVTIFSSYLKSALVYRADAWLSAAFSLFTVLAFCLLWSLLIPDGGTLSGFSLPEMMTYTLLCQMLAPLAQSSDAMWIFADEIRSGKFSKYMYTPVSPFGAFAACSLGKAMP